jgi:hypothetical protein
MCLQIDSNETVLTLPQGQCAVGLPSWKWSSTSVIFPSGGPRCVRIMLRASTPAFFVRATKNEWPMKYQKSKWVSGGTGMKHELLAPHTTPAQVPTDSTPFKKDQRRHWTTPESDSRPHTLKPIQHSGIITPMSFRNGLSSFQDIWLTR